MSIIDKETKEELDDILTEELEDEEFERIWGPMDKMSSCTPEEFFKKMEATKKLMRNHK